MKDRHHQRGTLRAVIAQEGTVGDEQVGPASEPTGSVPTGSVQPSRSTRSGRRPRNGRRSDAARQSQAATQPGAQSGGRRAPAPEPAEPDEALAGVVARLRDELTGMRRAMRNRAIIEQAKGVLVERLRVGPDDAFDHLVRLSQRANIKLAEVAAALVGATAPTPDSELPGELIDDELRQYLAEARKEAPPQRQPTDRPAGNGRNRDTEALQAQHQLLSARITTAQDYQQIAETIGDASTGWPRPDAVLIMLHDPSEGLRPVGLHGTVAEGATTTLHRVARAAYDGRRPGWVADTGAEEVPSVLAMPLAAGSVPVGALVVGWAHGIELGPEARRYLTALADPVSRRLSRLAPTDTVSSADDPVHAVLDSVPTPAALLEPVREADGRIADFRFAYTNGHAAAELMGLTGADVLDRTLLAVLPDTGSRLLLRAFTDVLEDGTPCQLGEVSVDAAADGTQHSMVAQINAAQFGDLVLLVWDTRSAADLLHEQLLQGERIGRLGSFWWNLRTGRVRWSPELYRLLGRTPEDGALAPSDGEKYVYPDDWYAVQEAIRAALLSGRAFTVEHRLSEAPERRLRMSGEPESDADGVVWAVRGTVQDVTEERAIESQLRRAQEALAAQRQRLQAESQAAETLQQALLPTNPELAATPGMSVRGLCRLAQSTGRVAGDWYDVFTLPGSGTYLVVGDVTGSGLSATVASARLRNAVRAYAVLGMAPGELLSALNRLVAELTPGQLATLVVARYSPDGHLLRWAAAGQAAPLRYGAAGRAEVLTGPLGLPVGAAPDIAYDEASVDVRTGDRVLLYTNGLLVRRDRTLAAGLSVLLHAGQHIDLAAPEALVEHVTDTLESVPDDDLCVILATISD